MSRTARIDAIHIQQFRSIPSQVVRLGSPVFLIGANGSGKSNFVDAFAFLSEAADQPLQAVLDRRGGMSAVRHRAPTDSDNTLGLGVELSGLQPADIETPVTSARYAFEARKIGDLEMNVLREQCIVDFADGRRLWYDREGNKFRSNLRWLNNFRGRWLASSSLAISVFGAVAPFSAVHTALRSIRVYSIDPELMARTQQIDSGLVLRANGANAGGVLDEIQKRAPLDYRRIGELLAAVSPGIDEVRPAKHGKFVDFEFVQRWGPDKQLVFDAFSMSRGTLQALGILLAVYQRSSPFVLIIEEPEASLHPGAVFTILEVLRRASERIQVLITTHSPEVLDTKWISDEHVRYVSWAEGKTTVSELAQSSRNAIRKHLMGVGEMLRSNALEPAEPFENSLRTALFTEVQ